MKYREKIMEILSKNDIDDSKDALSDWLETIPLLEQPDILREFAGLLKEVADKNGINLEDIHSVENFNSIVEELEEAILDEKLFEAKLSMAQDEEEIERIEREHFRVVARRYLMDRIVNDEEDAEDMLKVTKEVIRVEKECGRFDPQNWSRILHIIDAPS